MKIYTVSVLTLLSLKLQTVYNSNCGLFVVINTNPIRLNMYTNESNKFEHVYQVRGIQWHKLTDTLTMKVPTESCQMYTSSVNINWSSNQPKRVWKCLGEYTPHNLRSMTKHRQAKLFGISCKIIYFINWIWKSRSTEPVWIKRIQQYY